AYALPTNLYTVDEFVSKLFSLSFWPRVGRILQINLLATRLVGYFDRGGRFADFGGLPGGHETHRCSTVVIYPNVSWNVFRRVVCSIVNSLLPYTSPAVAEE